VPSSGRSVASRLAGVNASRVPTMSPPTMTREMSPTADHIVAQLAALGGVDTGNDPDACWNWQGVMHPSEEAALAAGCSAFILKPDLEPLLLTLVTAIGVKDETARQRKRCSEGGGERA
jgi:hypothetical protein